RSAMPKINSPTRSPPPTSLGPTSNEPSAGRSTPRRPEGLMTKSTYIVAVIAVSACGRAPAVARDSAAAAAHDPNRIPVDSAQRARFRIDRVDSVRFTPIISTTGTVAFSADRSTQVLAPMSGPVARILVNPGASVRAGEALAAVVSPDFASAVAGYRKA